LGRAEDTPITEQVERLVRTFAFASSPNLDTNSDFKIHKMEVKGLWEELKIEIFNVDYLSTNGKWFNGYVGIYHNGKITPIAPTFGGHGLMSGLISNGDFYYTYSCGSGMHRSHVAKLRITNDKPEIFESGGFQEEDLFVSTDPGGKVRVLSGTFEDFNHWETAKDIGFVGSTNASALQIIDVKGKVVIPTF